MNLSEKSARSDTLLNIIFTSSTVIELLLAVDESDAVECVREDEAEEMLGNVGVEGVVASTKDDADDWPTSDS